MIMQHADPIMDVEFSPDGEKVASISQSEVRIWSVQDGGLLYLLERYPNEEVPSEIAFTPDGNLLSDGAQVWNLIDGTHIRTLGEGSKRLTVAFSPDGTLVAVNGEDTEVELWKVSDGLLVRTFGEKKQWTRDVAFSLDGRILASIPLSRTSIQVWRVSDGTLLRTIEIPMRVSSMVFLPNGALVLGVPDGRVILWDVNIGGN
ncbi:MAG: hypothetical protein GTO14_22605 [Anaerolineales bacterium]|nr:hypothetical protein [Anaerolineales bacterium]